MTRLEYACFHVNPDCEWLWAWGAPPTAKNGPTPAIDRIAVPQRSDPCLDSHRSGMLLAQCDDMVGRTRDGLYRSASRQRPQSSSASRQFGGCLMVELTQFKPTERSSIERTSIQDINFRGTNAASPRMTGAPAEEEIDEPTGTFLRPGSDIAYFKLLAYLSRAD